MTINIIRYRPRKARVAVAYNTKDRTAFTRQTIAKLLDNPNIDLYWFDGSSTEVGRALPGELCARRVAICELHLGVVGGPDCAIMYALQTLQVHSYDLTVLIENDVLLQDDWLDALHASMQCGQMAGFKVGAASVRVLADRVLSFNDDYCLLLNAGAGCVAFTPPAVEVVLANYRTVDTRELFDRFHSLTGLHFAPPGSADEWRPMSADWLFDLMLYLHGYVVTAPPVNHVHMLDHNAELFVTDPDHSLRSRHQCITRPSQIRSVAYPLFRFQKSPLSERLLVGCHHLRVGVGAEDSNLPVWTDMSWRREWLQGIGPFALGGSGQIRIQLHGERIGCLMAGGQDGAEVELQEGNGSRVLASSLAPHAMAELTIDSPVAPVQDITLRVISGRLRFIGITASPAVLSFYANARPSFDHLPA